MNDTLKIIKSRRSTRAYLTEQIKEEDLQFILEAGYYAPSSTNQQPWHFTVVQNRDLLDRLSEGFKKLARNSGNNYLENVGNNEMFHVFYHAPTVIFLSGEAVKPGAVVDCSAAAQNMLIEAESLGLGSCWVGFIAFLLNSTEGQAYLKELGIPDGFKQIHSVVLGYKKFEAVAAPERKQNIINYIR